MFFFCIRHSRKKRHSPRFSPIIKEFLLLLSDVDIEIISLFFRGQLLAVWAQIRSQPLVSFSICTLKNNNKPLP